MCIEYYLCDVCVLGEEGADWMAVVIICEMLGHKTTIETKQKEGMIPVELAHPQASDKELCRAQRCSL